MERPELVFGEDPYVERWLRFKRPLTQRNYTRTLRLFINTFAAPELGLKDPSMVVGWAKTRADNLEVQDAIEKFGEAQPQTCQPIRMATIRSFLKRNGVSLPSIVNWRMHLKDFHRGYTRDEIKKLVGFLDPSFDTLYALVAKDSGLRASTLLSLRYRHIKRDFEAGKIFVHLELEPEYYEGRKSAGKTFIGPNCIELLRRLIHEKRVSRDPDAKLFPFAYVTITQHIENAREKAGLDPKIQPSHGFRKFFEGSLDRVGMDVHKKLQIEGHSQGVRVHYTDRDIEGLRQLYQEAYQYLTLSEETGAAETRVQELEQTVSDQEKKLADRLQTWEDEKAEIKTTIDRLAADLERVTKLIRGEKR